MRPDAGLFIGVNDWLGKDQYETVSVEKCPRFCLTSFLSHRGHGEAPRQVYPEAGMGHTCLRDNERILGSHTLVEARLQRGPRASVP